MALAAQAIDEWEADVRAFVPDENENGIPDEYERAPYVGFTVLRGRPPADLVLSVFPQPVRTGRSMTVALLHPGRDRVLRMSVTPDIGTPLMIDRPSPENGLTRVSFDIPKEADGDSLRVTILLSGFALSRTVPLRSEPAFGEFVYIEELPEALKKVAPTYPDEARRAGIEGTVMVHALVGRDGRVKDTVVLKSIPGLDAAAQECVRQWTFKPARAGGAPVPVWVAVPVRFSNR